ncbi:hypothetical protein KCMC57_up14300 [Kitasatospora sp. CMC57]|uniref:Uncharacterized protein n=1 Tax=Kitasatospora sp. CMC57 TaxID=3231513 RepID=A0AB33JUE9_9ACTN
MHDQSAGADSGARRWPAHNFQCHLRNRRLRFRRTGRTELPRSVSMFYLRDIFRIRKFTSAAPVHVAAVLQTTADTQAPLEGQEIGTDGAAWALPNLDLA